MDKIVIGVDLGGTIVRAGAFDEEGNMLSVREIPIEAARGPELGLRKIQELIDQVRAESEVHSLVGIGIGSTGPVDPIRGRIHNPCGGLMKSSDLFLPAMQEAIESHSVMVPAKQVRILPAQLGYHAGLYGAAYTIWSMENEQSKN